MKQTLPPTWIFRLVYIQNPYTNTIIIVIIIINITLSLSKYIMMMYCVCYQCVYHNVNNHHQQLRIVHGKKGIYCYHSIYISFYRQPTSLPNSFIRKKNLSYTHLHTNIIKHHSYVSSIYVHLYLSNEISHNRRSFYSFIIHFHVPSYTIYMIAYNNNKIKGINIIYIHKKH